MFKSKKEEPNLSSTNTYRLSKIFEQKKWPIENPFGVSEFNNFCNLFASLTEEQRELMFNLTNDFLWIQSNEYIGYFAKAFDSFVTNFDFGDIHTIIITPLLTEDDFFNSKSSDALYYMIMASQQQIQSKYNNFNISFIDNPKKIFETSINQKFVLCLIDDFIGTGETAKSAVQFFLNNKILINHIAIVSLVVMKTGYDYLQANKFNVFYSILKEKGISDSSRDVVKEILIMEEIEKNIGVKEKFKFGYGRSEALVKMIHTPNNTFPIYWLSNNKNKYPPFPR